MARFEPTAEQKRAIESRAKTVVVSAGAGSGKTAVLAQRIVSRLCEDRADIDRFLVVTYTNAAAFEMRSRIADKIGEKIAENLGDPSLCEHLRRQVGRLPAAKVQTVHSFCLELVRRNFSLLDLSSHFTIGDESLLDRLRQTAVTKTLDDAYASPPEGFDILRATLCEERGDKRLAEAILSVFDRLQSLPYPEKWLEEQLSLPEGDGSVRAAALSECRFLLSEAKTAVLNIQTELEQGYSDILAACKNCFDYLLALADRLDELLEKGDIPACTECILAYKAPSIRAPKDAPENAVAYAKSAKDTFKAALGDIKKLLALPDGGQNTRRAEDCLCRLVLAFGANLAAEKRRADVVDFNDLEHFAVKLLSGSDGGPSQTALDMSEYLCELMVDEYQDSNRVQDTIFSLVAPKNGSAFFVGDIKQSIYRFRKADPRIFAEKCRQAQHDPESEYIAMDRNFRSRPEVLSLCNYFFERTMTEGFGDVNYREKGQGLTPGRQTDGLLPSELCLIDTPSVRSVAAAEGEDSPGSAQAEAEYVAARIKEMLLSPACTVPTEGGSRRAVPSDFAILLSSFSAKAPIFRQALEEAGISALAETEEEDPFGRIEASVIISLLRIISNRRQDIPLLCLLRSPVFCFTPDDLALMRSAHPAGDLWDSLAAMAEAGSKKCAAAAAEIDHYCALARDMSCSKLLQYIYARTGAYGIFSALDTSANPASTLDLLYQTALRCEGGSFAGVSALVDYIDRAVRVKAPAPSGEGVRMMSIHKSKGLEFPFVFVCDLSKRFNNDDTLANVLIHPEMGLALKSVNLHQRVRTGTKKRFMISRRITNELRAEELRKLYVAMTRAREKLFLVISSGQSMLANLVCKTFESAGEYPTEHFISSQISCSKWLIAALFGHPDAALLRSFAPAFHYSDTPPTGTLICSEAKYLAEGAPAPALPVGGESDSARLDFDPMDYLPMSEREYPYAHISRLPSKITPSGARALVSGAQKSVYIRNPDESGDPLTAAEKGTRVHALLSRLTFEQMASAQAITAACAQKGEDCPPEDAAMAAAFAASPLGRQAAAADECLREYQFSALVTPAELGLSGDTDEHLLLNGSIDMLLVQENGLVIIDFKTDSVKAGSEQLAAEKHRAQLETYALAAQKIFEKPVTKKSVFFLKTAAEAVL